MSFVQCLYFTARVLDCATVNTQANDEHAFVVETSSRKSTHNCLSHRDSFLVRTEHFVHAARGSGNDIDGCDCCATHRKTACWEKLRESRVDVHFWRASESLSLIRSTVAVELTRREMTIRR